MKADKTKSDKSEAEHAAATAEAGNGKVQTPKETNGPKGLEPTRYGDWEQKGRCTDF